MEAIKSYLENMFLHLPKTAEVMRAKEELAQMMEDKYSQLRSEGRTDNEAVGQVISEFGNLEELAETLGIPQEVRDLEADTKDIALSDAEVERYLQVSKETGKRIALGVGLILLGVANLIFLNALAERGYVAEKIAQARLKYKKLTGYDWEFDYEPFTESKAKSNIDVSPIID